MRPIERTGPSLRAAAVTRGDHGGGDAFAARPGLSGRDRPARTNAARVPN